MKRVKPRTINGQQLVVDMRTRLYVVSEKYKEKISKQIGSSHLVKALEDALKAEDDLSLLRLLPGRTVSDSIWKPAVRDLFKEGGHIVLDCDDQDQDTRECGHRHEYKVARQSATGRFVSRNSTRHPRVQVDLFVADSETLEDCGVYVLSSTSLQVFGSPARKNKGWQLSLTSNQLLDTESIGAYRMNLNEYAKYRMEICKC
ncbi:MAG: hypothetical protein ACKOW9_06175 [Candidatus Paceibacterota bacterium]